MPKAHEFVAVVAPSRALDPTQVLPIPVVIAAPAWYPTAVTPLLVESLPAWYPTAVALELVQAPRALSPTATLLELDTSASSAARPIATL